MAKPIPPLQLILVATEPSQVQSALAFLQRWNEALMQRNPRAFPRLTTAVARYVPDPRGVEKWQPADVLLRTKRGNCDSFAAYEAAWLKTHGFPKATAIAEKNSIGYHCVVYADYPRGRIDPSARLGMPT